MSKIMVYPTHQNALVIAHPSDGPLSDQGSLWQHDGFTARMLTDGAVTTDKARGHISTKPKLDASKPPSHAAVHTVDEPAAPAVAAAPAAAPSTATTGFTT